MKIEPGAMVVVIGATIAGGDQAIGHYGMVRRWVGRGDYLGGGWFAKGDGWIVDLKYSVKWEADYCSNKAVFPATSLMPIPPGEMADDTPAESELETTQPVEV